MNSAILLKSPAKINLFLRILHRREDGYHALASIFQAIDLFDHLKIEPAPRDCLTCSDSTLPTDRSNLIWKAIDLFRKKTGRTNSFKIHLEKNIPQQAGLGGGSSNAATALWAVNSLCGNPVSIETLMSWSAEIGSDLSFFFSHGTAYCTGRGEKVQPLPPLEKKSLWIVKPIQGLSTPAVYKKLDLTDTIQCDPKYALSQVMEGKHCFFNDLETAAFALAPELAMLKQLLIEQGFSTVLMSGSGSSFFCMGDGQLPKEQSHKIFPATFIQRYSNQWYN
jgi:4-diphosphocytidyl-2-C-methyl-D-erythritol kinase